MKITCCNRLRSCQDHIYFKTLDIQGFFLWGTASNRSSFAIGVAAKP